MRAYMGTKAYALSTETPEFLCISKAEADTELKRRYPNATRKFGYYDPEIGDVLEQRYIRDYPVWLPMDMVGKSKSPKDVRELWVITTAYVTQAGPSQEGIWGVAYSRKNAVEVVEGFFPNMKETQDGSYVCMFTAAGGRPNPILIKMFKMPVIHNDGADKVEEPINKNVPGRVRRSGSYSYSAL